MKRTPFVAPAAMHFAVCFTQGKPYTPVRSRTTSTPSSAGDCDEHSRRLKRHHKLIAHFLSYFHAKRHGTVSSFQQMRHAHPLHSLIAAATAISARRPVHTGTNHITRVKPFIIRVRSYTRVFHEQKRQTEVIQQIIGKPYLSGNCD